MKILITGAAGFIGGHLVSRLASEHEVFAVTRHEPGEDAGSVRWIEHDLSGSLAEAPFPEQVDAVIHLAQSRQYRDFPGGAADMFAINVESTFRLLEYARRAGARTFVFTSTGGVYGSSEHATESDPLNPLNFYMSSKASAEVLVASYRSLLDAVILRLFFVYGPGQAGMMIPSLLERVRTGAPVTVDGDPGLKVNPIHVRDAVAVFEPALRLGCSDLFNVAGDEAVTITELVRLMAEVVGRQPVIEHRPANQPGDLIGSNERMKEILGVRPRISLREGLRSMLDD